MPTHASFYPPPPVPGFLEGWASRQDFAVEKRKSASQSDTPAPAEARGEKRGQESKRLETLRLSYLSGDTEEPPGATDQMSQAPWRPALPQSRHGPGQDSEQWLRTPGLPTQHWGRWARLRSDRTVQPLWMGARAPGWGRSAQVWQSPPDGSATPPQHPPAPPSRVVLNRQESAVRVRKKSKRGCSLPPIFWILKEGHGFAPCSDLERLPVRPREGKVPLGAGVFPGTSAWGQPGASSLP